MPANNRFNVGIKNNVSADMVGDTLDLYFLDTIQNPEYFDWNTMQIEEGNLVADIISQVQYYKPAKIVCHIDTFGGNLPIAISIYSFLKDYSAKVECKILGFCASAGTVIACAANKGKLTMAANGFFITHEASGNDISGNATEIRQQADVIDQLTKNMADILAARNTKGLTAEEMIAKWKDGDWWVSGEDAKNVYGFVDDCYNSATATVTARLDEAKARFTNAPQITASIENTDLSIIQKGFMELKSLFTAALEAIKGGKVDSKSANITAEIADALAKPFSDLAEGITAQVNKGIGAKTEELTATITAAVEAKNKETIDALKKEVAGLQAELEKQAGASAKGNDPTGGNPGATAKKLTGKLVDM